MMRKADLGFVATKEECYIQITVCDLQYPYIADHRSTFLGILSQSSRSRDDYPTKTWLETEKDLKKKTNQDIYPQIKS